MTHLKLGLIGCGHWGPNYIRVLQQLSGADLLICADLKPERLTQMNTLYPALTTTQDIQGVLNHPELDAVIVATPASTHFELVKQALLAGKHVLCEKPLTLLQQEGQQLVELAAQQKKLLMVGHTFLFNSGIRQLKKYIQEGLLGDLYYAYSARTNLGPIRHDVNSVADLATHDIAIFNYLFESLPLNVSARGHACLQPGLEDVAFVTFSYPGHVMAHAHVSWLNPVKVRQITLVGSKKMIVWDDINVVEPIRIYDVGIMQEPFYQDFGQYQLLPKQGDTWIPRLFQQEPLKLEVETFLQAVRTGELSESTGQFALDVVQVLEAIEQSMQQMGVAVKMEALGVGSNVV